MTVTTSTSDSKKSFFKDYLFYKIRSNKIILFASSICAFFSNIFLPIIILNIAKHISHLKEFGGTIYSLNSNIQTYSYTILYTSIFCLFFISITNGVSVFQHLTSKKKTDTLMSLPLTHGERFWGDFLTGFAISVAPSILFGIVGIILAYVTNNQQFQTFGISALLIITLIFSLIFNYVISVLAASICGNKVGGMFVSAILNVVTLLLPEYLVIFFSTTTAGFSAQIDEIQQMITPPSATFFMMFTDMDIVLDNQNIADYFPLCNPVMVCLYIILFAGIITASYFLAKRRKAEHNGKTFAVKHGATVVSILVAVTFSLLANWMFIYSSHPVWTSVVIAIACVLVFTATELALRQGVKKLGKRIAVYGTATVAIIGIALISMFTHGFGISYYIPSTDKITSVEIVKQDNGLVFSTDDKKDIEKIHTKHADILEEYINNLSDNYSTYIATGINSDILITYTLENGKKYVRNYTPEIDKLDPNILNLKKCAMALDTLPQLSKEYPKQYSQYASDEIKNSDKINVHLKRMPRGYSIKADKYDEFAKIYSDDVLNNFTPDTLPIGCIQITDDMKYSIALDILESYTNTIEFLKNPDNLNIPSDLSPYEYHFSFYNDLFHFSINITAEDLNNPCVQQLEELMIEVNPNDYETYYNYSWDNHYINCNKNDYFLYYIEPKNFDKAIELITKFASESAPLAENDDLVFID